MARKILNRNTLDSFELTYDKNSKQTVDNDPKDANNIEMEKVLTEVIKSKSVNDRYRTDNNDTPTEKRYKMNKNNDVNLTEEAKTTEHDIGPRLDSLVTRSFKQIKNTEEVHNLNDVLKSRI